MMFINWENVRVYLRPNHTDLRKSSNGLSGLIQHAMKLDPFSGHLFLFCNRRQKILKVVYWDRNGFSLWQKNLTKDKFPWPKTEEEAREIDRSRFQMLLNGIDFFKEHQGIKNPKL